ncbi:hypothetical protein PV08_00870 [Exophiala spinifera]|uniref:EF-hand domain-containing protein n=1 Tax=Exophiala spinifera TaxID=91928 RepID=A0A0D2BP45_9EURO|nr:uncharacterized protein PV08_00870 [Exophiala spinifera]KIW20295.1 hypothetical protein PV08_00870 [Exophiala spinifera]
MHITTWEPLPPSPAPTAESFAYTTSTNPEDASDSPIFDAIELPRTSSDFGDVNDFIKAIATPAPTTFAKIVAPRLESAQLHEMDDDESSTEIFDDLSAGLIVNGTRVVSKDQYLGHFGLSKLHARTVEGQSILQKFLWHDRNGDGYLDADEMMARCDENGCED